jgi:hypothetical protein
MQSVCMTHDIKRAYAVMKVTSFHRRMKLRAIEYKGGKCIRCGYGKSPAAMVFHHRDPKQKDFAISSKTSRWEVLQPELDKCDLLCSNCHHEEHERIGEVRRQELWQRVRQVIPQRMPALVASIPCAVCGVVVNRRKSQVRAENVFCSYRCAHGAQERVVWPDGSSLRKLVWRYPVAVLAQQLGISGSAIKKRCTRLRIQTPSRGYWTKLRSVVLKAPQQSQQRAGGSYSG